MGNYARLEVDFVERTLKLIKQYDRLKGQFPFDEQYDHTLLINAMLGLIILPKEKSLSYIPKERLAFVKVLNEWGINRTWFNEDLKNTTELLKRLRNSVAHFDIEFMSETPENHIDLIRFVDKEAGMHVATFQASELRLFIEYYANLLIRNMQR